MKKVYMIIVTCSLFAAACSNSNTVNVPVDSNNVSTPIPHDTATNMRDSARHPDTSTQHKL